MWRRPEYVTMSRGNSSIGVSAVSETDEDRFGLWVYVDDVDVTLERLRTSGAQVVAEPRTNRGGSVLNEYETPAGTSCTSA